MPQSDSELEMSRLCFSAGCGLCFWPENVATWRRWSGRRGASGFPSWITGGRLVRKFLLRRTIKHETSQNSLIYWTSDG